MDLSLTPDQETFRATVRAWLTQNIPRDWKPMGSSEIPRKEQYELLRSWQRSLFEAGFIGLTWPKEYGGRGLTFMEELILQQETALANVKSPVIGLYAGNDARIGATVPGTEAAMKKLGKAYEAHTYPHATHSFLWMQDLGNNFGATADAWPRTIAFFRQHLATATR